jgi:3-isopropylmalate/(R)-2-methylmalate dehydratase large subunit
VAAQTLFEKIWAQHVVAEEDGETLLYVDRLLVHEGSNHAFISLAQRGIKVARPSQVFAFTDHYMPTHDRSGGIAAIPDPAVRNMIVGLNANASLHGVRVFGFDDPEQGILHIVPPELGITQPGLVLCGADSHTSTHGAFGTLAFGIGASEAAHVLASQQIWQRKPKSLRITIDGVLSHGVHSKDVILGLIATIGVGGATGHVIEYAGSTIAALSMEGRMTICNMSIEAGGRAGMIAPDDTTFEYMHGRRYAPHGAMWSKALEYWKTVRSDPEACFDKEVHIDAAALAPTVTWGTNPEHALPVTAAVPDPRHAADAAKATEIAAALNYMGIAPGTALVDIPVDKVFIGSCTNSRIEDLRVAARVARLGKAVIPAWVVPGSRTVKRQAEREGLDRVFIDAGFEWREPGCSLCTAINGDQLRPGERSISTSNRNFRGRQGTGGRTHLASPASAAAAALTGRITDVRTLLARE